MVKIGIITFHWASNYGAVLQAYALQQFLMKYGYQTEIIDYLPHRTILKQKIKMLLKHDLVTYVKERNLKIFRKKELKLSSTKYWDQKKLVNAFRNYQVIIAGSDQIWNMGFTLGAEGKPTLSYFLKGAGENIKRIAYAVSFGTENIDDKYRRITQDEIKKFHAISVREKSGLDILKNYQIEGQLVCDPTLLLQKEDYEKLIVGYKYDTEKVFSYILHDDFKTFQIAEIVNKIYQENKHIFPYEGGMYEWIYRIHTADIVVTNSYHGVMMSLIFNTPFLAVLIEGSGMNDRLLTILKQIGLENRIVTSTDEYDIEKICMNKIDWRKVNENIDSLKKASVKYLLQKIKE